MYLFLLSSFAIAAVYSWRRLRKAGVNALPPGPKPLPLLGNIFDLPTNGEPEFQHWLKHKDQYGPISSVTVLGQAVIILHDRQAAMDILDKTATKSSGRPGFAFAAMCGFNKWITFMQHDSTWREQRKAVHQQLGTKKTASQFNDVQDLETRRLLVRLKKDPQGFFQHIRSLSREAAAIILRVTYGYAINPREADPLMLLIDTMMDNFSKVFVPAFWVVDSIPSLRFLPSWLPGMGFKTTAADWLRINHQVNDVPYSFVQQQMQKGTHRPSYVSRQIEESTRDGTSGMDRDVEETIKWTASIMYAAGSDTTTAVISGFVQAMVMFPDVQAKAQDEIDRVVGSSRLPEPQDEDQLPYVSAVVKEALRWCPVTPAGVSHVNDEEIEYAGFTIPKGSIIMPATWWFQNDPQVHANPSAFEPERFLAPRHEPDPAQTVFGHGRRVCPGRFLAELSLFLTISRILAVLNVRKAVDKSGLPIDAKLQFQPGMIARPAEFSFDITARSPSHAKLVEDIASLLPKEAGDDTLLDFGSPVK
ncbi:hypothetical protein LLEC1_00731 [Akanthomyces lecanii]|uniref:Uncharacterized protein n=1 Tax=Cordyceps confragosa TaxID=2714763 RepID=A0A179IC72_CORDF|nr:hypothetical protein LLEC1_00731 [Akanthomyces lecanii]